MSSTNKTTYYELPQYVENDIFNPLADDNDAYAKIDTALHNIADAEADNAGEIVGIKNRLDGAEGDIDALEAQNGSEVLTTVAQTLSGAVNELKSGEDSLDGRLDIVEDDINNVSTGLKAKVGALETQNGSEVLTTTAQTLSGAVNELDGDINNETTGLNAKVTALETQNGSEVLTTTAQTLSGAVNELDGDVATLATQNGNTQLNTKATTLSGAINEINNDITMSNRYFLFVGDSYDTIGTNTWSDLVAGILGCSYEKRAAGGYGFYRDGVHTWKQYLIDNPVSDNNLITDIVIAGGANDAGVAAGTLSTAIIEFNTYIKATYPNLKRVYLAFIGWTFEFGATTNYVTTEPTYKELGEYLGWRYINYAKYAMHNPNWMEVSGQRNHPLPAYVSQIAYAISQGVINGDCSVEINSRTTFTLDDTKWTGANFNVTFMEYNDITFISFPDISFTALIAMAETQNQPLATTTAGTDFMTRSHYFPFTGKAGTKDISGYVIANSETQWNLWIRNGSIDISDNVIIHAHEECVPTMWL